MAGRRKRKAQEWKTELAPTLNEEAEASEQEEVMNEEEEEKEEDEEQEYDDLGEEERPVPEPVEWRYLTDNERVEKQEQVREWLCNPQPNDAPKIVSDLLDLAVDELVGYAHSKFFQHQKEAGALEKGRGRQWERDLQRAEAEAASSARLFRSKLRRFVEQDKQDKDAIREVLKETVRWWAGEPGNLDWLLKRCADQMAAVLVFKNLRDVRGTTDMTGENLWDILFYRTAERVILPKVGGQIDEDRVRNCIMVILSKAKNFEYQGLGQAINFFTNAFTLWEKQQSPQVETEQLPEPEEESRIPPELTDIIPEVEDLKHKRRSQREKLWSVMVDALGRDDAIKKWILKLLREEHNASWDWEEVEENGEKKRVEGIAQLVLKPRCGLLDDDDLPPCTTWEDVERAFQGMKLTPAALRKFYSRANRKLRQYGQHHPEADPRL